MLLQTVVLRSAKALGCAVVFDSRIVRFLVKFQAVGGLAGGRKLCVVTLNLLLCYWRACVGYD